MKEAYQQERDRLERELAACVDVKAAADCLCAGLERVRLSSREAGQDRRLRAQSDRLFEAARQALRCMLAITEAEVSVREDAPHQKTRREHLQSMLPTVFLGVSALLTVWLILLEQSGPAILAVIVTALGWLQMNLSAKRLPTLTARTRPDSEELLRLMDRLIDALDGALSEARQEQEELPAPIGQPCLTGEVLEPVQMLLEAVETHDGDYALKAVPRLAAALMEQGVETMDYSPENEQYFDMFPGTEPGLTIRAALFKDGKLLVRGQATEAME